MIVVKPNMTKSPESRHIVDKLTYGVIIQAKHAYALLIQWAYAGRFSVEGNSHMEVLT